MYVYIYISIICTHICTPVCMTQIASIWWYLNVYPTVSHDYSISIGSIPNSHQPQPRVQKAVPSLAVHLLKARAGVQNWKSAGGQITKNLR